MTQASGASHETIYAAMYAHPRGSLKPAMIAALRQEKPARGRRRTSLAEGGFVPEELSIKHRPKEIAQRLCPGTGKATSSKAPSIARPWARRSSTRHASWSCAV
jgi:IS30 family transposase